jgi:hypothetical protein
VDVQRIVYGYADAHSWWLPLPEQQSAFPLHTVAAVKNGQVRLSWQPGVDWAPVQFGSESAPLATLAISLSVSGRAASAWDNAQAATQRAAAAQTAHRDIDLFWNMGTSWRTA